MENENSNHYVSIVRTEMVREGNLPIEHALNTPRDAAIAASHFFRNESKEKTIVVSMDSKNKPIAMELVGIGTLNQCLVGIPEVFRHAIISCAASIMFLHNHPSGDVSPSREDFNVTRKLYQAGKMIGIRLLDHIIVGSDGNYHSMLESGQIEEVSAES